jgi:hypothetical protein
MQNKVKSSELQSQLQGHLIIVIVEIRTPQKGLGLQVTKPTFAPQETDKRGALLAGTRHEMEDSPAV